jgi:hypothetical protein
VRRANAISGNAAAVAADWLYLSAAPTFAIMALLTGLGLPSDMLCMAMPEGSPLSGMTLMYMLMGVFHAAPWLRLLSRRWAVPHAAGAG